MTRSLSAPQFDDERTVLAARSVVPLEKINARHRHRRQWFLGGAFAIAMMLGAASALLASYLELRNIPRPVNEVSQTDLTAAPLAVAESVAAETTVLENVEEPVPSPVTPKKESSVRRSTVVAKRNEEPDESRDEQRASEQDELHRIREAVLYDEWQERRARRALRRERRRAERYNHRDLSNLDEIFEGSRRP